MGVTDSDYLLGTTGRFRSMGRFVPNGLPKGKKADTRPWVDITNEAQHVKTHVESAADRPDPVLGHGHVFEVWILISSAEVVIYRFKHVVLE